MICRYCGTENNPTAKFCRKCGQNLESLIVDSNNGMTPFDDEKTVLIEDVEDLLQDEETMVLPDILPEKFEFKEKKGETSDYRENCIEPVKLEPPVVVLSDNKTNNSNKNEFKQNRDNAHGKVCMAGISAIVTGIGTLLFYQEIKNFLSATEAGIACLSIIMIIGFVGTLVFACAGIKDSIDDSKATSNPFVTDMYFWIPVLMVVFTLLSFDVIKAAMMGIDISSGSYSWGMIGDAADIYQGYATTKTCLIIDCIFGIVAIVCKFANINPNVVKKKVSDNASQVIKQQKSAVQKAAKKSDDQYIDQLRKLKGLLDDGIISEKEFEEKKRKLLDI